jgi:3-hydroxyisobutyrate dehydrogenase
MSAMIAKDSTRIGWIGTGVMGRSMCKRLMDAGFALTVHNRTRSKAEPLLAQGAKWADSPKALAQHSDVLFLIVGYPHDVQSVVFGPEGVLEGLHAGALLVDMTTSQPELARRIAEAVRQKGAESLDAPVSGGDLGAREGRLSIMIGGDAAIVKALDPIWNVLGQTIVHQGPSGAGQQAKLANQILVAGGMIGVCEALLFGYRAGLDIDKLLSSVSSGAAASWALSNLAPRILRGDLEPGFFVEHFVKDMRLALEEARRLQLALPGLALVEQLYVALAAQGHSRKGTQALVLALAKLSGIDGFPPQTHQNA